MKRYEVEYGTYRSEMMEDPDGLYVLVDDHDRMRRRLLVKLLRERAKRKLNRDYVPYSDRERAALRWAAWCEHVADRIEAQQKVIDAGIPVRVNTEEWIIPDDVTI